jgi:hypothetical protein
MRTKLGSALILTGVLLTGEARLPGGEAPPPAVVEAVGRPVDGLRSRLVAAGKSFRAGHPIPVSFEVENVGKEPASFGKHPVTASMGLAVTDAEGKTVPFLPGPAGVMSRKTTIESGERIVVDSFDLEKWFYLRKPGKYAVSVRADMGYPPTEKLAFEVTPDPAGAADGDPIGRLLPLVEGKQRWLLTTPPKGPAKVRPGKNRKEVPARLVAFQELDAKRSGKIFWFWLAEEPAEEDAAAPAADWPPETQPLGKVGRWHVYLHAPKAALPDWPTVAEEVKRALAEEGR